MSDLTEKHIEEIWDKYVGDPTHRHPLERSDKHVFAHAVIAAHEAAQPAPMEAEAWAELHTLRLAVQGPDGFATWQDAAVAERVKRVKAERAMAKLKAERAPVLWRYKGSESVIPAMPGYTPGPGWTALYDYSD